jgi:signal transduction histidine kinase
MEHELRILHLEDSPQDSELVRRELRRTGLSFAFRCVDTRAGFVEQLEKFQPDLIISDYQLPSFDGLTALALVRERYPELPFILASGFIGEEGAAEALKSGATDFLLKANFNARLVPAVQRAMREAGERTKRKRTEEMLHQAQKMEAIGNLTGGMAHDFNNLLGIIIGNLDLLRDRQSRDPDADELCGEALSAALRGADLTRRLLAFARRQPLQPARTDVNELIAGLVKLLERTLGEQIRITLDLQPDTWPVVVDPAQLESALTNLATNARDAMSGGGQLIILTGNRSLDADYAAQYPDVQPGDYAMIEVRDTGSGMPSEVASRIFEPFYTTKEEGKGTGLGLSMVFGFMKQSGGHINAYSEVGIGTIFRLFLPHAVSGVEAGPVVLPVALVRGSGETVLAVEDNAGLSRVVVRQLGELGYRVLEAENAQTALRVLESEPVDLVFTDIVMPGGTSGYELARAVRSRWPAIRIVLTSGFPENNINGGPDAPNLRLLSKPYRKDELGRLIREVLDS